MNSKDLHSVTDEALTGLRSKKITPVEANALLRVVSQDLGIWRLEFAIARSTSRPFDATKFLSRGAK